MQIVSCAGFMSFLALVVLAGLVVVRAPAVSLAADYLL